MAEGLARRLAPAGVEAFSAGSQPAVVNPFAVRALADIGIDAAAHTSKGFDAVPLNDMDVVITLCAEEVCPEVPGKGRRLHWPLPDPAGVEGTDGERMAAFRAVRDEIISFQEYG